MPDPKKPFVDDVTIVSANFLNSVYGGLDGYSDDSPYKNGHFHDGGSEWGSAPKVNLTDHVVGRLILPAPELKSIKLTAAQAVPQTSSLFWTIPIPNDAYTGSSTGMFLNIYWSGNAALSPSNAAFRVDWTYISAGQNVMPPSIQTLGSDYWPANTSGANNPSPSTFRFKASATPTRLYVNDSLSGGSLIPLTLPVDAPSSNIGDYLLFGLEVSTAPTVTLTQPMSQANLFAVEILYYSQTLGNSTSPTLLQNDYGLADF